MYMQATQEHVRPIKQFLAQYREEGRLRLPKQEWAKFSELFQRQTKIQIDFQQNTQFSFLEILTAATWFVGQKYAFRADVLGLSINSLKTNENRIKIKLGFDRTAQAYLWFVNKKIIQMAF